MNLTFLGTGTSLGVPMIGCTCAVCQSTDPRNRRRRSSVYVAAGATRLVIDTSPDFREQALTSGLRQVDAVLFTHAHADHILGLDDIRRFNTLQSAVIPVYAAPETMAEVRRIFSYIGRPVQPGLYRPQVDFRTVEAPFRVGEVDVTPLPVDHGTEQTIGYLLAWRGHRIGYVPDCHRMPESTIRALAGVQVMVLDTLRYRPHATHLCVAESLELLRTIGASQSYLIHLCHDLEHARLESELPPGIRVAYDGLVVQA
ncbi:MAG: MBL fold metallo-hydrolase [Kiritimatiellia bacterium]